MTETEKKNKWEKNVKQKKSSNIKEKKVQKGKFKMKWNWRREKNIKENSQRFFHCHIACVLFVFFLVFLSSHSTLSEFNAHAEHFFWAHFCRVFSLDYLLHFLKLSNFSQNPDVARILCISKNCQFESLTPPSINFFLVKIGKN